MAQVELRKISKSYGDAQVIREVDLTINDQELTVFVGPSGCGKSTLLRLIAGLEEISSGELLIDQRRVNDVPPAKRGLALVFQSYALYPHMNVSENMAFSLKLAGLPKVEREKKVMEAARILNLESYLDRKPKELSGGQRQRVAIGRAIVRNPKVFLFDEPLSNLDAALRVRMRQELTKLHRQLHATMIYVTHDQVEAMTMADRIVVLRAGVVEQVGSSMELYHRPKNQFVAGFIGSPRMNFLEAVVQEKSPDGSIVALPGGFVIKARVTDTGGAAGDRITLGIRPEHLTIVPEGGWNAKVQTVENLGSESYVHVQINDGQAITVRINGAAEVRPDQMVQLQLNLQHLHVFDQEGRSISFLS